MASVRRPGQPGRLRMALGLLATILSFVAGSALIGTQAASASTPQAVFSLRPAAEGQVPLVGGHFAYSVAAGSTVSDAVIASNLTDAPLSLRLFGADLVPLQGGGFGVSQLGQGTHGAGSWLSVSSTTITVAPHAEQTVPFTVSVPRDAFSGDYGAAIAAQNSPSANQGIAVQFRVALQVRLHVTGQNPRLGAQVGPLSRHRSGRSMQLTATLTNTGNESFVFDGTVRLRNGGRDLTLQMSPAKDYLYPGQKVTLTATWPKTPTWGSAHAQATVVATPALGGPGTFTGKPISMRFFPWWLVLMAILALLLLIIASVMAWRNRKELRRRLVLAWRRRQAVRRFKGQFDIGVVD